MFSIPATIYTHAAVGLLAAALATGVTWQVQQWRCGERLQAQKADYVAKTASAALSALKMTEHYRENADAAVKKAEARMALNKRDADGARAELDGLRGELATVPALIARASGAAVAQYAATATVVFEQCGRRLEEVARDATGHAADVATLSDAWPGTASPVK